MSTLKQLLGTRLFGNGRNPSADLYFYNIVRDCRKARNQPLSSVKCIGDNTFVYENYVVICRKDRQSLVEEVVRDHSIKLIYIMDDDLWGAACDPSLPEDYRRRQILFKEGQHHLLADRADGFVVSSPKLLERYTQFGKPIQVIHPYWSEAAADGRHFNSLDCGGVVDVAYLGTTSHQADRAFALAAIIKALESGANIRFTLIAGRDLPDWVQKDSRIRLLQPQSWRRYRRALRSMRFHLAIYPVVETPFNEARSLNKLFEHQVVGALGLYSRSWHFASHIAKNSIGITLDNSPQEWADTICNLASKPDYLAAEQRRISRELDLKAVGEEQRNFWSDVFVGGFLAKSTKAAGV